MVLISLCDLQSSISSPTIWQYSKVSSAVAFYLHPRESGAGMDSGPGLPEVAGQLSCQNPVPICAVKKEGECRPWYSPASATLRKLQQLLSHLACSRASSFIFYVVF